MYTTNIRHVDTGIIQRGKTYRFTAYLGYNSNGRQIRKTMTFCPPAGVSGKQADKLAKEAYIEFCNRCRGLFHLREGMRFSDLAEEYLQIYAANLKPVTYYNYKNHIYYHFIETLGRYKLREFTPAVISHFYATHETMRHGVMQVMSPGNAKKSYSILQGIFSYAVSQGYLRETPCKHVILPKRDTKKENVRTYLYDEELPQFLSLFEEDTSFNRLVKVLLLTGVRVGECLGLMWSDIDFNNRKIFIQHNLSEVGGKHYLTTPKTSTSVRYLYIGKELLQILQQQRIGQEQLIAKTGASFKHPEMVFTSSLGNYTDRSFLTRQWKNRLKGSPFSFMTLHKLRHTNATMLLNHGIDLKIVSEHLGHSNISITADIYTAVLDKSKKETAIAMERLMMKKTPKKHQKGKKQDFN